MPPSRLRSSIGLRPCYLPAFAGGLFPGITKRHRCCASQTHFLGANAPREVVKSPKLAGMIGLFHFVLAILASPFKSKLRLEAENAMLRHQLIGLEA
jgi:hypothetical protein